MLDNALLLFPDFLLIACGFVLCRYTALDRVVWGGAERLVYWLLFPALLFIATLQSPISLAESARLGLGGVLVVGTGFVLSALLRYWPGVDQHRQASGAQIAFRFNSYVALALAERLGGAPSVAGIALLIALCVPLCNFGAVWSLARHGGHDTWREVSRNPLIIGTLAGLAGNLLGLHLPPMLDLTLHRISAAALPLGLMAVGAGLQLGGLVGAPRLAGAILSIRHLLLPALGLALGPLLGLPRGQALVLAAFAALPTASSCYVLAARMGGDGPFVAGLVTASTLLGMLSVPLVLVAFALLG
ncbi:MAG: hypothetical protein RLY71_2404 [Pseudomonadota bacterium]|jgi:predicted permease